MPLISLDAAWSAVLYGLAYQTVLQGLYLGQQSLVHTSTSLRRDLTEGTPSREPPMSGFQKLKNNLTNLVVGGNQSGNDPKGAGNVDR